MFRVASIAKRTVHAPPLYRLPPASYSRVSYSGLRRPLLARTYATTPESASSKFIRRGRTLVKYTFYLVGSSVVGCVLLTGAIFLHDAFTYTDRHIEGVPVAPRALQPERGGPKNLPILSTLLSDWEDDENRGLVQKPHLVIVGGGWGAVGVLDKLNPGDYHVTIVSPETYTTFTPLLPSAAVGTVSVRSLVEPLRKIAARLRGHLINARAVDLVMSERLLEVETISPNGVGKQHMYIPYDKLIIAVGSTSSTHGVPGLQHCFQLKTVSDAQAIRKRIIDNFEAASLPTTTPEERRKLLSFVVCGGGPTGVETAAEIYDLCQEDLMNYFPKICREEVSIHVIQSRSHILNTYSEAISRYAEDKFARDQIDLITSARVASVDQDKVTYTRRSPDGKVETYEIPTNFVLWSTGIAMNPFTKRVSEQLPNQVHKRAIEVDAHLRVKGAPLGTVYAIGDASTIETSVVSYLLELVDEADKNKDGRIDYDEWEVMVSQIKKRIPMAEDQLMKVRELFDLYDSDSDNALTLNELAVLLQEIGNKITALPATAQVASQQGKYLGKKLSQIAERRSVLEANGLAMDEGDEAVAGPFRYRHLGSLAYIGNAAVFDLGRFSFMGGLVAMYAWRSVYWSEQVSMRTRALLMIDWVVRGIWGRDLSRL
ncbi:nucleotide-binding domain-containing protein [Lentinus tigrinus ALCF2SS1-7]|uniref:Nucleotide-binding domain-containing protein n=1 Tax=Lentinus tigrinus ALCF2SS1-6 TaxID=1328759 RepID=A0A5C2SSG3_9APHY|nr:nucleotide-binding domain-containing protein [Lentinus tigrinus ALCF2SS1-6]RPD80560.1 nucleotide-binding domain-containing protein [Lentinus tigrinus ALCF2SS1-7]